MIHATACVIQHDLHRECQIAVHAQRGEVHDRAHARARDVIDRDTMFFENLQDADVREPEGTPAAQRETDLGAGFRHRLRREGGRQSEYRQDRCQHPSSHRFPPPGTAFTAGRQPPERIGTSRARAALPTPARAPAGGALTVCGT